MVFTGILNNIFVKNKKLYAHHWFAMLVVGLGLATVSILASVYQETDLVEAGEYEKENVQGS